MTCPQPVEVWEAYLIERPEGKISPTSRVVNFKLKPLEIKTLLLRAE